MFIDVLLVTLSYTAFRHIVFLTHWGSVTLWAESVRWSIRWRGELASLPQSSTDAPGVLVNTNLTDSSRRNGTWIEIFQSWHLCSTGGNLLGCVHNVILDLYISVSNWNLIKIIQYPHCVSQLIRSDCGALSFLKYLDWFLWNEVVLVCLCQKNNNNSITEIQMLPYSMTICALNCYVVFGNGTNVEDIHTVSPNLTISVSDWDLI